MIMQFVCDQVTLDTKEEEKECNDLNSGQALMTEFHAGCMSQNRHVPV